MTVIWRRCMRLLMLGGLWLALYAGAQAALPWDAAPRNQSVVQTDHVRAELLVYAPQGIAPGATVWLGLKMAHQPQWHTYWDNPGDTGLPTSLTWQLPAGVTAGDVQWPAPKQLPIQEGLVNYGYDGTVLLPVQLAIGPEFQGSQLDVSLRAEWLACRVECIPESGDFRLTVPAQQSTISEIGIFESTWENIPQTDDAVTAQAHVSMEPGAGTLQWRIQGLPESMQGRDLLLFPQQGGVMANSGPLSSHWEGNVWTAVYPLLEQRLESPDSMRAVLTLAVADQETAASSKAPALWIEAQVEGQWPAEWQPSGIPPALQAGIDADRAAAQAQVPGAAMGTSSWLGALLLAFAGGLLLNLMPCVFPVLSIKALTFAQSGGHTRGMHIATGLAYGLGVVITMLILAGVMLALRATGSGLGWGFQLQSPVFVALLAVLFTLIGLNLLGVFQVLTVLPGRISDIRGKTPSVDAFFSGIVSVLIATPCTAPFMGAALGVALVLPAWQALSIFLALGIGLALPLMLLACMPALAQWLPRPGAWMETFRRFMAFPMLATVLWLVWVIGLQTSVDGAVGLLAILLALALLMWVWGWSQQHRAQIQGRSWRRIAVALSVLLLAGVTFWAAPSWRAASVAAPAAVSSGWQPWSAERVQQLQAQGQPVFIDFTAAWCMTCQVNKRTTLTQPEVLKAFANKGVVLLQADWTRPDPAIAAELQRLGRSGLPVYVLLVPGQAPQLLPEVLTPGIVYQALDTI